MPFEDERAATAAATPTRAALSASNSVIARVPLHAAATWSPERLAADAEGRDDADAA